MKMPFGNVPVQRCGVYEAKTRLSELLERAGEGHEIIITRRGRDVARLVPIAEPHSREVGFDAGLVWISEDFDTELPDDMLTDIT
jgi:prevent-host-death family protein